MRGGARRVGDAVAVSARCTDVVECGEPVVWPAGRVGVEVGGVGLAGAAVVE
jgi:hypothetical protein